MQKILIFLLCISSLNAFQLKSRLDTAKVGDTIVYAYKSQVTLVRIDTINDKELVIEEISTSSRPSDFRTWRLNKAPGHTSWIKSVINRQSFKVVRRVSVDDAQELDHDIEFLPTLMKLDLQPIADRKKIGAEPQAGEVDHRRLWNPKIVFNSKELTTRSQAYRIQWPDDASELSGRLVDVYIPDDALSYLPYWIEVYSGPLKFKIFVIDSYRQEL